MRILTTCQNVLEEMESECNADKNKLDISCTVTATAANVTTRPVAPNLL
jgi:hypothetical protein